MPVVVIGEHEPLLRQLQGPTAPVRLKTSDDFVGQVASMRLNRVHHIAIICSDYRRSRHFYSELLGLRVLAEQYRAERDSWKLDLALPDGSQLELFSFPNPPARPSWPEACGLRHLAFEVDDVAQCKQQLEALGVPVEPVRLDSHGQRRFVFFADPDGLPLELYERLPIAE